MPDIVQLLVRNRNYRSLWFGQIVSEVGDHFNNIAVLSLAVEETHSGAVVAALMLSSACARPASGARTGSDSPLPSAAGRSDAFFTRHQHCTLHAD